MSAAAGSSSSAARQQVASSVQPLTPCSAAALPALTSRPQWLRSSILRDSSHPRGPHVYGRALPSRMLPPSSSSLSRPSELSWGGSLRRQIPHCGGVDAAQTPPCPPHLSRRFSRLHTSSTSSSGRLSGPLFASVRRLVAGRGVEAVGTCGGWGLGRWPGELPLESSLLWGERLGEEWHCLGASHLMITWNLAHPTRLHTASGSAWIVRHSCQSTAADFGWR